MTQTNVQDHHRPFQHAFDGLIYTLQNHSNLRIHLIVATLAIILGLFLKLNLDHWLFLSFTILLVLVCEMINTSLEKIGDAITLQFNPAIKVAKDVSAGMVLLSCVGAVIIGFMIFIPYLNRLFNIQ